MADKKPPGSNDVLYKDIANWLTNSYNSSMETNLMSFSSNDHMGFSQFLDSVDDYGGNLHTDSLDPSDCDWNVVDNKFSQDLLIYSMDKEVNFHNKPILSEWHSSDLLNHHYTLDNACSDNLEGLTDIFKTEQKFSSVGKKIDVDKQCYVFDINDSKPVIKTEPQYQEESCTREPIHITPIKSEIEAEQSDSDKDIDVESICVDGNPILEAPDILNLLEQFEASEATQLNKPVVAEPEKAIKTEWSLNPKVVKSKVAKGSCVKSVLRKKLKKSTQLPSAVAKREKLKPLELAVSETINKCQKQAEESPKFLEVCKNQTEEKHKSKLLESLPKDLITRIKNNASFKRKSITVIDPIPSKIRIVKKSATAAIEVVNVKQEKPEKPIDLVTIRLDHSYCESALKEAIKEVKTEPLDKNDPYYILKQQPTVTNSNGKIMISLLKNNTIKNTLSEEEKKTKRKLNIEEYKKRRGARSVDNSASNSPLSSGCSSPTAVIEDETTRYMKHKKLLNEMAAEVLSAQPKSIRIKNENSIPTTTLSDVPFPPPLSLPIISENPPEEQTPQLPPEPKPRSVKSITLVAIGINTDISGQEEVTKTLIPAKEIEEIKPILESAKNKINRHSLITTVLENVEGKQKSLLAPKPDPEISSPIHQGEDKTIIFEEQYKSDISTNDMSVQTDLSLPIQIAILEPTPASSVKSSSSSRRRSSNSSCSSRSDSPISVSDSYYSSSRSRSPSPRKYRSYFNRSYEQADFERACEERRILFVGGVESNCTENYLKRRFGKFGPISNVRLHFRRNCDNYGFVTFANVQDTHEAVEHGNDDPKLPRYSLSYGGRRYFCKTSYSDLDYVEDRYNYLLDSKDIDFDDLLASYQYKQFKRKTKEL